MTMAAIGSQTPPPKNGQKTALNLGGPDHADAGRAAPRVRVGVLRSCRPSVASVYGLVVSDAREYHGVRMDRADDLYGPLVAYA